jgi:drug/metabolite transporter (DMT)-like permease
MCFAHDLNRGGHVAPALLYVAAAAICSGTATVLQAIGARQMPVHLRLDHVLVWRLLHNWTYVLALVLVGAGAALSFAALRSLPLFVVQAGRASSLGVAALLATVVLGARLRWVDFAALIGIATGLVLLAGSVRPTPALAVGAMTHVVLAGTVVAVIAAAALALKIEPVARAGLVLATIAGVAFAVVAVAARTLPSLAPAALVADPDAWTICVAGALGLALSALAVQRAAAVATTALLVGVETTLGAGLGMVLAGDRPVPSAEVRTAVAFALVLVGALAIARFASPDGVLAASSADEGDGPAQDELSVATVGDGRSGG